MKINIFICFDINNHRLLFNNSQFKNALYIDFFSHHTQIKQLHLKFVIKIGKNNSIIECN
jgi:hypothetical protein